MIPLSLSLSLSIINRPEHFYYHLSFLFLPSSAPFYRRILKASNGPFLFLTHPYVLTGALAELLWQCTPTHFPPAVQELGSLTKKACNPIQVPLKLDGVASSHDSSTIPHQATSAGTRPGLVYQNSVANGGLASAGWVGLKLWTPPSSDAPFWPVQRIQRIPHNHKQILAWCLHNDKAERGTSKWLDKAPVTKERRAGSSPTQETLRILRGYKAQAMGEKKEELAPTQFSQGDPSAANRGSVGVQGMRRATFWAVSNPYPCGTPKKAAVM